MRSLESKITERGVGDPEAAYKIAQAYSMLGDKGSALRVLGGSVEGGFFHYPYLATDPLLDALRKEPQFAEILNTELRELQRSREIGTPPCQDYSPEHRLGKESLSREIWLGRQNR